MSNKYKQTKSFLLLLHQYLLWERLTGCWSGASPVQVSVLLYHAGCPPLADHLGSGPHPSKTYQPAHKLRVCARGTKATKATKAKVLGCGGLWPPPVGPWPKRQNIQNAGRSPGSRNHSNRRRRRAKAAEAAGTTMFELSQKPQPLGREEAALLPSTIQPAPLQSLRPRSWRR